MGGQTPPRPDQAYTPSPGAAVAPGSTNIVRANKVIVSGPGEGVFSYSSSPPAAGTLVGTAGIASAGSDPYGNQYLAGTSSYGPGFAVSMIGGALLYYTGSLAAGWSFVAQLETDPGGDMLLVTAGGVLTMTAAGNVSISGNLAVSGTFTASGDTGTPTINSTSTNGLANGQIAGTSGGASAGTAHTHGGGSYAVTSGQHNHDLQNHEHPL
jgi:hypothetical protein